MRTALHAYLREHERAFEVVREKLVIRVNNIGWFKVWWKNRLENDS
jgi:hypothetical protein